MRCTNLPQTGSNRFASEEIGLVVALVLTQLDTTCDLARQRLLVVTVLTVRLQINFAIPVNSL